MQLMRPARATLGGPVIGLALLANPALGWAQADPYRLVGADMIALQTCREAVVAEEDPLNPDLAITEGTLRGVWREVSSARYAFFVASYAGQIYSLGEAQDRLRGIASLGAAESRELGTTLYHVQEQIAAGTFGGLAAFRDGRVAVVRDQFDENTPWSVGRGIVMRCKLPETAATLARLASEQAGGSQAVPATSSASGGIDLRLRGTVEALSAVDAARRSAAAATFGYSRVRTFLSDGSRKETDTYSINAVAGVPLLSSRLNGLLIYGGYELKQQRTTPVPPLIPPATQADGDTEIIKLGLLGHSLIGLGGTGNRYSNSIMLAFDASYIFNQVKDSERIRGRIGASFYFGTPVLGICRVGGYHDFGNGLWSRCELEASFSYNSITRQGTVAPSALDHFGHFGGRARIALFHGNPLENSAFATAEYQNLRRIGGDPLTIPHVRRHRFGLGYRWWSGDAFGLEVKAELLDGINPDSFADENSLSFGFGLIF